MSDDNLILFPKKSKPVVSMSNTDAKWMLAGSLLVVLTLALGVNSALFSQNQSQSREVASAETPSFGGRAPASINPIFRVSWEKRAFEVLSKSSARDLANVGQKPSVFDKFAFGTLEGHYSVRKIDGKIAEIQYSHGETSQPKVLLKRKQFIQNNLALFAENASAVEQTHIENNGEKVIERFQLKSANGEDLSLVQVLLDKDQNLLSMTVQ